MNIYLLKIACHVIHHTFQKFRNFTIFPRLVFSKFSVHLVWVDYSGFAKDGEHVRDLNSKNMWLAI